MMMDFFQKLFYNLKLKKKLLISYLILIILPMTLFFIITNSKTSSYIEEQLLYSTRQTFDQTYSFLSYRISNIVKVSSVVALDTNINSIMSKEQYAYNIYSQLGDLQYIKSFLTSLQDNYEVHRIRLYVSDDLIYAREEGNIYGINHITDSKWFNRIKNDKLQYVFCPDSYLDHDESGENLVSIARLVKNPNNYSQYIGAVRIDVLEKTIKDIIIKNNTVAKGVSYIQNSQGEVITYSDKALYEELALDRQLVEQLSTSNDHWMIRSTGQRKIMAMSKNIENTDCHIVSVMSLEGILATNNRFKNAMLLNMLIICTLAYFLAYYISISITKRISSLIASMKKVQYGDLSPINDSPVKDDIGELVENYNFMIEKMKTLIEEQFQSGKKIKAAELKVLHAQINPHFLYNTLDLVHWLALKKMTSEIVTVVSSLAKFYKISLNKGKEVISLQDELAHVSFYVQIQNMRFANKLNLIIDVPEDLREYTVPKIILQPIIENSILHGILAKPDKEGTIIIKGRLNNNSIFLTVTDDGIGIPDDQIDKILTTDISSKRGSGFGIKNINDRIKLTYGDQYGLSFQSIYGQSTTVEVIIPLATKKN